MKKESGVTLVALVITIVVLLILAGISVAALTGQDSIFNRASQAKEETAKGKNEEEAFLNSAMSYLDGAVGNYVNGN